MHPQLCGVYPPQAVREARRQTAEAERRRQAEEEAMTVRQRTGLLFRLRARTEDR
jgi:hypothetical protein